MPWEHYHPDYKGKQKMYPPRAISHILYLGNGRPSNASRDIQWRQECQEYSAEFENTKFGYGMKGDFAKSNRDWDFERQQVTNTRNHMAPGDWFRLQGEE